MRKCFFLLSITCVYATSLATEQVIQVLKSRGTVFFACICKNGIAVVADSREVFTQPESDNHEVIAYYESSPKIFVYNGLIIAMAGQYGFDTLSARGLFNRFCTSEKIKLKPNQFKAYFFRYAKNKLNATDFRNFSNNMFLICGYENTIPQIFYYNGFKSDSFFTVGQFKSNVEDFSDFLSPSYTAYFQTTSVDKMIPSLQHAIQQFCALANERQISYFGGPVSSALITVSGSKWHDIQTKNNFDTYAEQRKAILNHSLKIHYRSEKDSFIITNRFKKFQ